MIVCRLDRMYRAACFIYYSLIREGILLDYGISKRRNCYYNNLDGSLQRRRISDLLEEEIAERFLEILKDHKLTPYKYIKKSNVSKNSVYNIIGKKNVGVHTLSTVCEDFGMNLFQFFKFQADGVVVCEGKDEEELVEKYRQLDDKQAMRLLAYLDLFLEYQNGNEE